MNLKRSLYTAWYEMFAGLEGSAIIFSLQELIFVIVKDFELGITFCNIQKLVSSRVFFLSHCTAISHYYYSVLPWADCTFKRSFSAIFFQQLNLQCTMDNFIVYGFYMLGL